jgi:predicted CXXCH cytochrome family protein
MKKYGTTIKINQLNDLTSSVHGRKAVNGRERILQCTTCHSAHGIRKVNDPASTVYPTNIPTTCTKCHGNAEYMRSYNSSLPVDQLMKYRTSKHGILNKNGNPKAAECSSCHGSHNILSSKDVRSTVYKLNIPATCSSCHSDNEYMKEFKIATDQYAKFRNSAHGKAVFDKQDISAPVCNDCHGNHGATPPGISSISNVCGSCHALNAELFSGSPHKQAFDKKNYPECETCHGSHEILTAKDQLLGIKEGAVCMKCHSESENRKGYDAAGRMSSIIDSLIMYDSTAKRLVFMAEQKGMEIEEAKFMLREIHQSRQQARTILHAFNEEKFREVTDKGMKTAGYVITDAENAIDEFYFRRYGLGAAVIIISFLIVVIFLYIKKIESK